METQNRPNTTQAMPPVLLKAMEQEIALSEEMVTLLGEEQQALVNMDMPALISISTRKGTLAARIATMDGQLQEMTRSLLGQPQSGTARLRALIEVLAPNDAEQVEAHRLRLVSLRDDILSKTIVNRKFTEETRQFLRDAMTTITGAVTERPMYGRGRSAARPTASMPTLISREV
ncbi:MAG: flagellar protein FlgN [Thermodesulfobacteriota bacterium]